MTIARHACEAHHLTGAHLQVQAKQIDTKLVGSRQAQALHLEHRYAGLLRPVDQLRRLGADHQTRQRGIGLFAGVADPGDTPPPQHRAGRAQFANFMQLVADVQNAAALRGQFFQHHEQLFDRLRCQHRGGLVQDQQLRVGQQSADDLDPLHLAHTKGVNRPAGVNVQAIFGRFAADAARDIGQAEVFAQAKPDILGHGDGVKQAEMLEHHADAQGPRLLRVADVRRLTVEQDTAAVRFDRAVDDLHQRRLAGPVFTQHRMDLTGLDDQVDVAVGHHAGVALGDAG